MSSYGPTQCVYVQKFYQYNCLVIILPIDGIYIQVSVEQNQIFDISSAQNQKVYSIERDSKM